MLLGDIFPTAKILNKSTFARTQSHQRKMFDLPPTKDEYMLQYTGEDDSYEQLLKMEAREMGDGSHLEFTDQNCDTSLFPYYAEGPLPAPIPTPAEILKTGIRAEEYRMKWRVGPYHVKACDNVEIFQVNHLFQKKIVLF
jgi:hypothetical protein